MEILDWLDKHENVKSYLKVGLLVNEVLDAYCSDMPKNSTICKSAAKSLQERHPVKRLGKVIEELTGKWGRVGSYENNRIFGTIKPNLCIIVESTDCFFTRPYYEISEAIKSCAPVRLLGEFNPHMEKRVGFHNRYAQSCYNRLGYIGLLKKPPGRYGRYALSKTGLKIFDNETIRAWESLKNWKHKKRFFKTSSR